MTHHNDSGDDLHLYHMMALVAARDGKTQELAQVLDDHPRLIARHGLELLFTACSEGHADCIGVLLGRGVPVNGTDAQGLNAVDHATMHRQWHMLAPLLQHGADADGSPRRVRHGKPTPLLMAAREGRPDIMAMLIQHSARTHYQDSRGENLLHHAASARTNQKEVMAIAKANTTAAMMTHKNCEEHEPLEVAIRAHNSAAIDILRQADAHHHRRTRGFNAGRAPIQRNLFDDPSKGGGTQKSGRGR